MTVLTLFIHVVNLAIALAYAISASNEVLEKVIPFDDGNIKYFGRWRSTSKDIQSSWPGAYLKTSVFGSRVKLRLNCETSIYVQIDDSPLAQHHATFQGVWPIEIDISTPNLTEDNHQLLVVSDHNAYLCLEALVLAGTGEIAPPTNVSPQLVEFIGHDLTLGVRTSQSVLTSFPWLVSDMLGIERVPTAYPDAWLVNHTEALGMEARYFNWSPTKSSDPWDFSSYKPLAIVYLLGQNDRIPELYTESLISFVGRVRTHLPDVPFLVLSEPLGELIRESQEAVHLLNDGGDQNVYFIDTTSWIQFGATSFADAMHLTDVGHARMARKLAPLLKAKLSTPPQPLPGPAPNPSLPHHWQTMDVGDESSVGLPGSVSFDSPYSFTLWGSGADIGGGKDAFRFVYQPLSADGSIEATVVSHSAFASCAKAGIMLREHLAFGSPHVMLGLSPADGIFIQSRSFNFNQTRLIKKTRASPPYHFRLVRQGNQFTAQAKSNDDPPVWQTLANLTDLAFARDIYLGLAVTSCDPSVVSVAKFANIVLKGGVGPGFYTDNTPHLFRQD